MERSCAVVVTFNRKKLLKECLIALQNQTHPIDKIFIIDNDSNDGTKDFISQFTKNDQRFKYICLNENIGGAGGFHEGIKLAETEGYDWIWLMDDDVEPELGCLEGMMKYTHLSKCLHPTKKYTKNGEIFKWQGQFDPRSSLSHRQTHETFRDKEYTSVNFGCFEGMLIHKNIVQKIGLPDKRYFIAGDDLMYGYLASKHTKVLYLRDPLFWKKIWKEEYAYFLGFKRPYQSPFYLYFNTRNHFLKKDTLIKIGDGSKTRINIVLFIKNIKLLIESLFFFRTKAHLKMYTKGLLDGINRNFNGHKSFLK